MPPCMWTTPCGCSHNRLEGSVKRHQARNLLAWIRLETLSLILQVLQKAGLFLPLYLLLSVGYSPSGAVETHLCPCASWAAPGGRCHHLILWVNNLRLRKVKHCAWGHPAKKCGVKVLNWVFLTSKALGSTIPIWHSLMNFILRNRK